MVSPNKLIEFARKWPRAAAMCLPRTSMNGNAYCCNTLLMAGAGHFIIYTIDQRRFMIPIRYLSSSIFRQLLKMSEEVYGLPSDGPIKLPCDADFLEHTVSLIRKGLATDEEMALLTYMETDRCPLPVAFHQGHKGKQLRVYAY